MLEYLYVLIFTITLSSSGVAWDQDKQALQIVETPKRITFVHAVKTVDDARVTVARVVEQWRALHGDVTVQLYEVHPQAGTIKKVGL